MLTISAHTGYLSLPIYLCAPRQMFAFSFARWTRPVLTEVYDLVYL